MIDSTFGEQMRRRREILSISQSGLAREIGTSQSAIAQIEGGERNASWDMVTRISRALRISISHLAGEPQHLDPSELELCAVYRRLNEQGKRDLQSFTDFLLHRANQNPSAGT